VRPCFGEEAGARPRLRWADDHLEDQVTKDLRLSEDAGDSEGDHVRVFRNCIPGAADLHVHDQGVEPHRQAANDISSLHAVDFVNVADDVGDVLAGVGEHGTAGACRLSAPVRKGSRDADRGWNGEKWWDFSREVPPSWGAAQHDGQVVSRDGRPILKDEYESDVAKLDRVVAGGDERHHFRLQQMLNFSRLGLRRGQA
jgi:hypothetical protein